MTQAESNAGASVPTTVIEGMPEVLCKSARDTHKVRWAADITMGFYCPGDSCLHCRAEGCVYADFIRLYWNHPCSD